MRSLASAVVAVSCGYLAVGVIWPHVAERMLQMLLVTLALAFVGARIYRSSFPELMSQDAYSPFERHGHEAPASTSPTAIRVLARQIAAVDDSGGASRAPIPGAAAQIVSAEASRRLAENHGLSLLDPGDQGRVRELLSEPTWALLEPTLPNPAAGAGSSSIRGAVPLSELARILDDLEKL
jgi:hypothetical protein